MATETKRTSGLQNAMYAKYVVDGVEVVLDPETVTRLCVQGKGKPTEQEIAEFIQLCKARGLNPLAKGDVYLIKYNDGATAQIVVGKTAYLKRAFQNPSYSGKSDGITVERKGEYILKEGTCLYPGEKLIGGWCRIYYMRNGGERTAFKEVPLSEYNSGQSNWKSKPATMINKVAISQCVREAFPAEFSGLYADDEMVASGAVPVDSVKDEAVKKPAQRKPVEKPAEKPVDNHVETVDNHTATPAVEADPDDEVISKEQQEELLNTVKEIRDTSSERNALYKTVMEAVGAKNVKTMTVCQYRNAMMYLKAGKVGTITVPGDGKQGES